MGEKTKVLVVADSPTVPTGFGRVGGSIVKYLSPDEYDISWIGVNYYGDPHKFPYRIYPAQLGGDVYGYNRISSIVKVEKPDIIFIINDAWIQNNYLQLLKRDFPKNMPMIVTYTPVDATEHDSSWYEHFDVVDVPVAYTDFGYREIIKAAPALENRLTVVPHGVDTEAFHKLGEDKVAIKESFYQKKEFKDYFIVLSAHRNQPRKRLDITMRAFQIFAEGKDDVQLYLHCGVVDESLDILKLASRLKIDDKLIISGLSTGVMGLSDEQLNKIYNCCDVGLNTGLGEGWGLPNVEHAVTEAAQVVPAHSSLVELWHDVGLLVPAKLPYTQDRIMTVGYLVQAEDVAEKLNKLYYDRTLLKVMSKKAYEKFSAPQYSWKNISQTWDKIFKSLV